MKALRGTKGRRLMTDLKKDEIQRELTTAYWMEMEDLCITALAGEETHCREFRGFLAGYER
jgi:hypothetical protein